MWRSLHREDDGVALIVTIALTAVMALLVTAALGYGTSSQRLARQDQDWNAALAAAEAGLDDYLLRLNRGGDYWQYNATNLPPETNAALTGWAPVPGATSGATFTYGVDASRRAQDGTVVLTTTGRVRDAERTVRATLRPRSALDYLYLSDYETTDPAAYTRWPPSGSPTHTGQRAVEEATRLCRHYRWERWRDGSTTRTGRDSRCTDIYWRGIGARIDVTAGPFHTNDTIAISGQPVWQARTTTGWNLASGQRWFDLNSGTSRPEFQAYADNNPVYAPPPPLPSDNRYLKREAETGGCLYTGPTRIVLNAGGTMTVTSPYTRSTRPGCIGPNPAQAFTTSLPANGVAYVQDVPASSGDPNYRASCDTTGNPHPLDYPVTGDSTQTLNPNAYRCTAGDVFLEGRLRGAMTIGAENNVIITNNLVYDRGTALGSPDILGLIAYNYVEVYHPVTCPGNGGACVNLTGPGSPELRDVTINAAILALQHSFRVQNHTLGTPLDDLQITGAIAQEYRGPVSSFNSQTGALLSGYDKDYRYDERLAFLSPPYFIDPLASYWDRTSWAEQ
jgi:hypothetical protein